MTTRRSIWPYLSPQWTGTEDSLWSNPENWADGQVPSATQNVLIPAGLTRYPLIGEQPATCALLNLPEGARLSFAPGARLTLTGDFRCRGELQAEAGTIIFGGTQPQTLFGQPSIHELVLDNPTGVNLAK